LRQLKTAQAQLDAAQARLKSAEEQLSYTELKSNAAGVITEKGAEVGEVVPAGKMILKVAQQSGRDAVFDVPAQAMRDGLALGEQVEVWLADHPDIKATGQVREISPEADPVTRNYQVKVGLNDPPPGMLRRTSSFGLRDEIHLNRMAFEGHQLPDGDKLHLGRGRDRHGLASLTTRFQELGLRSVNLWRSALRRHRHPTGVQ
jgi:hypothetical protein